MGECSAISITTHQRHFHILGLLTDEGQYLSVVWLLLFENYLACNAIQYNSSSQHS